MTFVVVLPWVFNAQAVLHGHVVLLPHEIVIPNAVVGHHEKSQKDITQKHLYFFSMRWQKSSGVRSCVFVGFTPLEALRGNAVCCQRTTTWRKAASNDDCLVG